MLEYNRFVKKKMKFLTRVVAVMLIVICATVLLAQTAFARNAYLINDGDRVVLHTTYATDPADILNEAGLQLGEDDTYTTQNAFGVSEITIQRKQTITILHGNKTLQVNSYGETVESLLNRTNLILTEGDVLSLPLNTATYDGMVLTISRSIQTEETYTSLIPHNTVYCYDASLMEGEEVVLTPGVDGQLLCTATVYYVNGQEVNRVISTQVVTRQPVDAVIAIGTDVETQEPIPMPEEPEPEPEPEPQPEPEKPEAPKQPVIGNGTITTPEGEVLTYTRAEAFRATAYNNTDPGCTEFTAIGTYCRVGAIAVDPRVIPYGTRMYIVTNDGEYVYGIAVAEDCGGSIKGNRVDLYFDTVEECIQFGIRDCTVYFLG